jgi:soluble lytic murein transglycosylase-like protein
MQILPSVGEELGPEVKKLHGVEVKDAQSLENPEVNVKVGAYYLFKLILKFGDVKNAIKAYNEGPTDIQRRLDRGKTMPRRYYRKILKNYRMIKDFLLERQEEQRRLALENERRRHVAPQNLKSQPSTP